MNWPPVEPEPRLLVLPPDAADLGEAEAAIELWEHYSGKVLDPDQRLAVHVMMAQDAAGKWAAKTTGREKPRQNGKGDEIEVPELWGLVQRGEAILHTVHDAVMLSTQTQQRMLRVLEGHGDLRRRIKRTWKGTGQQMIELRNGGTIWYRTRTAKGGLGVDDVDRVVLDEAQEATKEHLAAISPTMLANPNAQLNAMGTAGKAGVSAWWWRIRKRALSGAGGAFGYVGNTAERVYLDESGNVVQEPVDPEDRELWLEVNTAVRAGRGEGMDYLEEQFLRLGPALYAREHLCVWDPPDDDEELKWQLLSAEGWEAATVPLGPGWMADPVTLAVEVTPDRAWASIGAAGAHPDGRVALEVVEHRAGTDWVVPRLVELAGHDPKAVLIDPRSPAGVFVRDLVDVYGIEVTEVVAADYARACGAVFDALAAERPTVVHHGQPELDAAAEMATKRQIGDAWVFDRRGATVVTPLAAVTLAAWGHREIPDLEPEPDFFVIDLGGVP